MTSLPCTSRVRVVPLIAAIALATFAAAPAARAYEGYGYQTIGGQGGSTCHVTSLAASGSGSLADCAMNRSGARIVVFDVAGTISLGSTIYIDESFLTIDGSTAPSPGITVRPASSSRNAIVLENAHDIIIQGLRLQGYDTQNGADLIGFDGEVGEIYNVVLDHLTFTGADDGAVDVTNSVRDVTVSWCFFYYNTLTSLVKYGTRRRISYHHNVFARNGERNPQLQGNLKDFDYVNNIVYDWGRGVWGYGLRIRNVTSEGRVNANVVNNLFVAVDTPNPANGLIFGTVAGPDSEDDGPSGTPSQGTVVTTSDMGSLWVSGNILPPENKDQYSTVSGAIPVPPAAQVTTWPASNLRAYVLPGVGTSPRTSAEQALLNEIAGGGPIPSISIGDVVVVEGDAGNTVAIFPVSLSEPSGLTVTVDWSTADGTATAGSDYQAGSGTVRFPPATTDSSAEVTVKGDWVYEVSETFHVNLNSPLNGTLDVSQGQGTILDNDPPGLSIADLTIAEPVSGSHTATFTVTLSPTSGSVVTVAYATADITATAGSDYDAVSGSLDFDPGISTQPVNVSIHGDAVEEGAETFQVTLSNPSGAPIAHGQAIGTIHDRGSYFTLTPCRVLDTRDPNGPFGGPALAAGESRTFTVAGQCGIAPSATAVAVNVTVTQPTVTGHLRLYPAGTSPLVSSLNYRAGQTRANNAVVGLSASGQLTIRNGQHSGTAHVILDVSGYFE
jgi:pectate lyase